MVSVERTKQDKISHCFKIILRFRVVWFHPVYFILFQPQYFYLRFFIEYNKFWYLWHRFVSTSSNWIIKSSKSEYLTSVGNKIVSGIHGQLVVFTSKYVTLLYTFELFSVLENKLIGYADDSTLIAVVPSSGLRVAVAESPVVTSWRLVSGATFGG